MKPVFRFLILAAALANCVPSIAQADCGCKGHSRSATPPAKPAIAGGIPHAPASTNSIVVMNSPVTINNTPANTGPMSVVPGGAMRNVPAAPATPNGVPAFWETLLSRGDVEVVLGSLIAIVAAVIFFFLGRSSLHAGRGKKYNHTPGEWLDIGGTGPHGPGTIEIEARVRGKGATWSWQRISRQQLIDHLNSVPLVRDGLLETAPAGHHATGGDPLVTVVSQAAH